MYRLACICVLTAIGAGVLAAHGAGERGEDPAAKPPAGHAFTPVPDQKAIHNGYIVTDKVIGGAQPEGEAGFKALADLGVKTIISVDGARPDVETAKKFGIRYVHLPITYATVTTEQGIALAKAMEELPGPIYVHCHHGKHRSAAAVAVGCVYAGMLDPARAESVLETFGTGENYKGLWQAAREAKPVSPQKLRETKVQFVEAVQLPPLAGAMVLVDQHADHLKQVQKAQWKAPADHPDLDSAHEALQLQEHLHEIGRTPQAAAKPEDFRRMLHQAEDAASGLRRLLAAPAIDPAAADRAFARVTASCTACHGVYRD